MADDKKVVWAHTLVFGTCSGIRTSYSNLYEPHEFMVDRFGVTSDCKDSNIASIVPPPVYDLNNIACDWKSRYFDTVDTVADNAIKMANGRRLVIYYSGGVDSVVVLVALMRHKQFSKLNEAGKIEIRMTTSSINEYPWFFYNKILPNIKLIKAADPQETMSDPDAFIVTGDMGDYIVGSSDVLTFVPKDDLDLSLSKDHLLKIIKQKDKLEHYYNAMVKSIDLCPFPIKSSLQLSWWGSQCFAYQDELVRHYMWSDAEPKDLWKQDKVFKFFNDDLLTAYSYEYMSTKPKIISFSDSRTYPRQYIFNYTKDVNYLNKLKFYSQKSILRYIRKTVIYDDGSYDFDIRKKINL